MKDYVIELLDEAARIGWVMEPAAKAILRACDLPVTRYTVATTWDEAVVGAGEVGWPLVAKIVSPAVVHKSDVGGVVVGIRSLDELKRAWEHMITLPAFQGVLLDQMVTDAVVELIVGAKQDPSFGTVVLTGIGGTSVEIYEDITIRMAPLSAEDAESALHLKGRELIEGHRGSTPAHRDALIELLVRFSHAAHDLAERVESIDLNPVLATPDAAIIADARFILR